MGGGFKDFEKLINRGVKINEGYKIEKKRDKNRIILINCINFTQHQYF